ncbi:uncharacterized protein BO80DRAFT_426947 [Aspergillus ibericus CBS 121593]|uniref:Uncharacterized protein n=1 Tax=Aspergillus ibericus CBS 121593 TaxID=1448316 RepID=A0A395GTC8_9EURO|nr:hypothetical protein BO80DRAFT_426947 [Aspergillus ibericus CBS 121593]RAK98841.1 hypothetical protein BO80DRAFT_426947 [Aspergillus ibericus CBS 121593]
MAKVKRAGNEKADKDQRQRIGRNRQASRSRNYVDDEQMRIRCFAGGYVLEYLLGDEL